MVPDPEAVMPEDWDEDEDGDWEAPAVVNPAVCTTPSLPPSLPPFLLCVVFVCLPLTLLRSQEIGQGREGRKEGGRMMTNEPTKV